MIGLLGFRTPFRQPGRSIVRLDAKLGQEDENREGFRVIRFFHLSSVSFSSLLMLFESGGICCANWECVLFSLSVMRITEH